jgi:transposase
MSSKKRYEAKFKAEIALEAIKDKKTTAEICSDYKIPQTNLYEWRDQVLSRVYELFIAETEHNKKVKALEKEIEILHQTIGQLMVEINFLKKKLLK